MTEKDIKLNPKKNGAGYITSYYVSIGSKEARECGLTDVDIVKIIDTENNQIIIRPKEPK